MTHNHLENSQNIEKINLKKISYSLHSNSYSSMFYVQKTKFKKEPLVVVYERRLHGNTLCIIQLKFATTIQQLFDTDTVLFLEKEFKGISYFIHFSEKG